MPFERWNQDLTQAADADAQQTLLATLGTWRARNLTDIDGLRHAAFTMSKLYNKMGNKEAAVREARTLLSLCQTPPMASQAELKTAKSQLSSLGERPPRLPRPLTDRKDTRSKRDARNAPDHGTMDAALQKAVAGDHTGALRILKGKRGKAETARIWVRINKALQSEGPDFRKQIEQLERNLRSSLGLSIPKTPKKDLIVPPDESDGALGALLGRKIPRRRDGLLRAMDAWLATNPTRADELTAAAIDHHLSVANPGVAAPWLATFIAHAQLTDGTETAARLQTHAGTAFATMFAEPTFERVKTLMAAAPTRAGNLRRSVLGRNAEPDGRRAWTLRFDKGQRMIVVVPSAEAPYPADVAAAFAERLPHLCTQVVVLAPGAANAPLREAIATAGMVTLDGDPSDTELLSAIDRVTAVAAPERPARPSKADKKTKSEPAPKSVVEPVDEGPDPMEAVAALLGGDVAPTLEALSPAVSQLKKMRDAFLHLSSNWSEFPEDASERASTLMVAADQAAPTGLRIPEAVTLALRVAAAAGGPVESVLLEGPTAERFGGPGIGDVVKVVRAAGRAGWELRRAFRGTTRRERRNDSALAELDGALDGVWRLGVQKDDVRAEVWFVAELPVEGRAALPQLLIEERKRVVVLPIDAGLSSWYGEIGGPEAVGWTGEDDAAAVQDALAALVG